MSSRSRCRVPICSAIAKWCDYLDYCDYFYWAVPAGFGLAPFEGDDLGPDCAGLIVADRYDAEAIWPRRAACASSPRRAASKSRDLALRAPRGAPAWRGDLTIRALAGLALAISR